MEMHRFEVYVFDFENMGVDACAQEVERSKYTFITVKQPETADIGDWDDSHELNQGASIERFRSYFAALSQPAAAEPKWIDWAGGTQPVADRTVVDIEFRDGSVFPDEYADEWIWTHGDDDDGDIVAYCVKKATP